MIFEGESLASTDPEKRRVKNLDTLLLGAASVGHFF